MTNAHVLTLVGVSLAQALAMASPGPAFMLVSRVAAGASQRAGLATGSGVATFGVAVLLARHPAIYTAIQLVGAVYLISLGLSAWRDHGATEADALGTPVRRSEHRPEHLGRRAFRRGLWLSLGNPKIVLFYGGIFVSLIPADSPGWLSAAALAIAVAQEYVWYVAVATVFSRPAVQAAYRRARGRIERAMGAVFIALGARIAALAHL